MKARALERLGHRVAVLNLQERLPSSIWLRRLNNWTGYAVGQSATAKFVAGRLVGQNYDVAWVDSGQMVGPKVMAVLRQHARHLVNYNHDDPTGARDGQAWGSFKCAVPLYDLLVTVRTETEAELKAMGASKVIRVWRSYDEVDHHPREISADDQARWGSEVVFVGTWMPERGPFMAELVRRGLPLAIYGDFWPRAAEWPVLKASWRGPAVYGDDYAKAIQCSKIALGLLSKGNRDRHTQRSAEIPALGGLLCAQRTDEHTQLFVEGKEAIFWRDAVECVQVCEEMLGNKVRREIIIQAGKMAVHMHGLGHEAILGTVIRKLLNPLSLQPK
jgi:spore maturation protein CgeB